MLEPGQRAAARVNGQIAPAAIRQGARDGVEVGPPGNTLIGDRVQPRQRRSHVNLAPGCRRAPRSHSSAGMRAFPAGCTSKTSTAAPPVAITSDLSAEITSPGAPPPPPPPPPPGRAGGGDLTDEELVLRAA